MKRIVCLQLWMTMDFDDEIKNHLQWRSMVEAMFINNESSYVSPSLVITDDKCRLGQWIYSDDSNSFSHLDAFKRLLEIHKEFHLKAGTILTICNNGNYDQASELEDEFYTLSGEVVKCLEELKQYTR